MIKLFFRSILSKASIFFVKFISLLLTISLLSTILPNPNLIWAEEDANLSTNPIVESIPSNEESTAPEPSPSNEESTTPEPVSSNGESTTPEPSNQESTTPESSSNNITSKAEYISNNASKLDWEKKSDSSPRNVISPTVSTNNSAILFVADEVIITYKDDNQSEADINDLENEANLTEKEKITDTTSLFVINDDENVMDKINELSQNENIEVVQPNFIYHSQSLPNDTYFNNLWALYNTGQIINGETGKNDADFDGIEAWDKLNSLSNVIVGVIDSGIDYRHDDLKNMMWDGSTTCYDENNNLVVGGCPNHGRSYYYNGFDNYPLPYLGESHGTHVAGIIGAQVNNNLGVAGLAKNAKLMALATDLTTASLTKSIQFAENNGAKVINASWGGIGYNCYRINDTALYEAIKNFSGLFINAAGNDWEEITESFMIMPGMFAFDTDCWEGLDNIINVASTNNKDELSYFSNYSGDYVHVGAPGEDIYSTMPVSVSTKTIYEASDNFNDFTYTGNWGVVSSQFDGQSTFLKTDINNFPYTETTGGTAISPTIDLSNKSDVSLSFKINCDTEYTTTTWSDYVNLEISNDNNNYYELNRFDEDILKDIDNINDIYTGWVNKSMKISSEYLNNNFRFRLVWYVNGNNDHGSEGGGCMIDDIKIIGDDPDSFIGNYSYNSGTSMAAPQVTALTALLQGIDPTLSNNTIKEIILDSGDSIPFLAQKTISQKRINAVKAVEYLKFLNNYSNNELLPLAKMMYQFGIFGDNTSYTDDMELTNSLTRGELFKSIFKMKKTNLANINNAGFTDVSSTDWFYNYANGAVYYGLITMPEDKLFQANEVVNHAEIIKALVLAFLPNYANFINPPAPFTDDNGHINENMFSAAYNLSIIDGTNNATLVEPNKNITRAEFYQILTKVFIVSDDPESYVRFADKTSAFSVYELEEIIEITQDLFNELVLPEICDTNNDKASAELMAINSSKNSDLCASNQGDIDYYKIDITKIGSLEVYTDTSLDLILELIDDNNNVLAEDDNTNYELNLTMDLNPGTYYLKIYGENKKEVGGYVLTNKFTEISSEATLNVDLADAKNMVIVEGNIEDQIVMTLDFTANNKLVQLNSLEFTHTNNGQISDITNLALVEIIQGQKQVIANLTGFNTNNKALFSLNNYYISANNSKRLYLYAQFKPNALADTHSINLENSQDITYNGTNIIGSFPFTGNKITIVAQDKILSRIKNIYGDYFDGFNDFIIDNNYIYAVGNLGYEETSIAIIAKFDLNLNLIKQQIYDGPYQENFYKVIAKNNAIFVIGFMNDALYGNKKGLIVKYDNNLNLLTNKAYFGSKNIYFEDIIADEDNIFVVAFDNSNYQNIIIKFNHTLNLINQKSFDYGSLKLSINGKYIYGSLGSRIIKLDKNLNLITGKYFYSKDGLQSFTAEKIIVINDQIFLLGSGYSYNDDNYISFLEILKLDTEFNILQQKIYQNGDRFYYRDSYSDSNNLYLLVENYNEDDNNGRIVLKLDYNLAILGQKELKQYNANGGRINLYLDKISYLNQNLYIQGYSDRNFLIKTNEKVFTDEFMLPGNFTWTNSNVVFKTDADLVMEDFTINTQSVSLGEFITTPNVGISNYLTTSENFIYDNTRKCEIADWQIGNWSDCINGQRTRPITKISLCAGDDNKPTSSEICTVVISSSSGGGSGSSSGGGGSGGGKTGNINTVYNLPSSPSDEILHLNRPIKTASGIFSRPVVIEEYYSKSNFKIAKNTKVTDLDGKIYTNAIPPISKKSAKNLKNISTPSDKKLVYDSYFMVVGEGLLFSEPVPVEVFLPAKLKKYTEDNIDYQIMYWVPKALTSANNVLVASTDNTIPILEGKWQDLGSSDLVKDGKINFIVTHSTYLAFTTSDNNNKPNDQSNTGNVQNNNLIDIKYHWAEKDINKMYNLGIIKGRNNNQFSPNENIKRAEAVKMVLELFAYNINDVNLEQNPFIDVSAEDWFASYVVKAYQEGIIRGYEYNGDLYFDPGADILRVEILSMILSAQKANLPSAIEYDFTDVPEDMWFAPYVTYAQKHRIIKGRSKTEFAPIDNLTRAEAVTILMRVYENHLNQ